MEPYEKDFNFFVNRAQMHAEHLMLNQSILGHHLESRGYEILPF